MLTIKINTGNAAFVSEGDAPTKDENNTARNFEAANILREAASRLETEGCENSMVYKLRDMNGNRIGTLTINNR